MSNYVKVESLAFFDDEKPKLSLVIDICGSSLEVKNGKIHLYAEMTPAQIVLQLREYADYLTRSIHKWSEQNKKNAV